MGDGIDRVLIVLLLRWLDGADAGRGVTPVGRSRRGTMLLWAGGGGARFEMLLIGDILEGLPRGSGKVRVKARVGATNSSNVANFAACETSGPRRGQVGAKRVAWARRRSPVQPAKLESICDVDCSRLGFS